MWIGMAVFLMVAASATWLFISSRSGFALGLMVTVVLFGAAMGAGLASLILRDRSASQLLGQTLKTERHAAALASETARIGVVLAKFRYYRLGAGALGLLAVAGLMLSDHAWVHGFGAGLFLVVAAQVVIDHFSEQRALIYLGRISSVSKSIPPQPLHKS
jgi:hypothetical protein